MADGKGVTISKNKYFFGFAKFFSFKTNEKTPYFPLEDQASVKVEDTTSYITPIKINCPTNVEKICVSWSSIFYLCQVTGKVQTHGWCNGRKIAANENVFLPIDNKICNLKACWQRMVLISDDGKCHVISNIHNDWAACVCENESRFSICDVGDLHTIILDEHGKAYEIRTEDKIKCIRSNCQLFPIHLNTKVDEVSCGKEHVLLLNRTSGRVFSFGLGSRGQLGHGEVNAETAPKLVEALAGIKIQHIAAGGWHSLALSDIGDIYAWGWNISGQLGISCLPPEVPQAFYMLPYIIEFPQECTTCQIACGARHSGAVTSEPKRSVWTWGWGQYGQLGHGDAMDRTTPTRVEYFDHMDGDVLDIDCGPWQTVVTLAIKTEHV